MLSSVKQETLSLQNKLRMLKQGDSVVGLKAGTEVEDMSFEEINLMKEIASDIVPLTVKIGGAEARQDIRMMLSLKVNCLLAPMIESVYTLSRFVETAQEIMQEVMNECQQEADLAFNLETITAVGIIDHLIEAQAFSYISQVTIGRDDLSRSMRLDIGDDEIMENTKRVIKKIKNQNKLTSVGGGLSLDNIKQISECIESDYLNTRNVVFKNDKIFKKKPEAVLFNILNWEKDLYILMSKIFPERASYYDKRIKTLSVRCDRLSVIES